MSHLIRTELWSDVEAAGGTRLAMLPGLLSLSETVSLEGEYTVALSLPADHPAHVTPETSADEHNFQGNKVIRMVYQQPFSGNVFSEHRIATSTIRVEGGGRIREVTARAILTDLAIRGLCFRLNALGERSYTFEGLSLSPRAHIEEFVLPALEEAGQAFWSVRTIDSIRPVDVTYDRDTPLSALRKIATAAGNLELYVPPVPLINSLHYIDLLAQIGGGVDPIIARARRNLLSLGFTENSDDQATRVYAFGAPEEDTRPTMATAEWGIGPVVETVGPLIHWITLVDPAGGVGPLVVADQFASGYRLQWINQAKNIPILATDITTNRFKVDNAGVGVPLGEPDDRVRIVRGDLSDVAYVEHPAMVASYGVRVGTLDRSDIPATTNVIPNAFLRVWGPGAAMPDGWTASNVTVTQETDQLHWVTAGQSAFINSTTALIGLVTSPFAALPLAARGYLSFMARVKAIGGVVRARLVVQRAPGGTLPPHVPGSPRAGGTWYYIPEDVIVVMPDLTTTVLPPVQTTQPDIYQDIGIAAAYDLTGFPLDGGRAWIELFIDRSVNPGANFYVDAVQVTISASQQPWLEGNGGVRLFQAANERLLVYSTPATPIDVSMLDLATADGDNFPDDQIVLGAPLTVLDPDGGIGVTTRILGWSRDWMQRLPISVKVSDDRQDVMSVLARAKTTVRHGTVI